MDIKVIGDDGKIINEASPAPILESMTPLEGGKPEDVDYKAIGQVLGLETDSLLSKYSDNLKTLTAYAKSQTTDHTPQSLKWVIRSLELKLGTPPLAEDRVKYVARFAWLANEERRIQEEKKKFEKI